MADKHVHGMMEKLQNSYPEHYDDLIMMMGIDINWRMHQSSNRHRRRLNIMIGLKWLFKVILFDDKMIPSTYV